MRSTSIIYVIWPIFVTLGSLNQLKIVLALYTTIGNNCLTIFIACFKQFLTSQYFIFKLHTIHDFFLSRKISLRKKIVFYSNLQFQKFKTLQYCMILNIKNYINILFLNLNTSNFFLKLIYYFNFNFFCDIEVRNKKLNRIYNNQFLVLAFKNSKLKCITELKFEFICYHLYIYYIPMQCIRYIRDRNQMYCTFFLLL